MIKNNMAAGDDKGDGDGVIVRYSFLCGLRGYHQYRLLWTPVLDEILTARSKIGNYFDCYAIAVGCHRKNNRPLT